MANNNRRCKVCGEMYEYCPSCYKDKGRETWHVMFHDSNCMNIFQICLNDFLEHTTREETIALLSECDLSQLENYADDIKNQIKEILNSNTLVVEEQEKETEELQEELVEQKPTAHIFSSKKKKK